MQYSADHGGVVYVAAPGEKPSPRRRPSPVYLRGRAARGLAGRDSEVSVAVEALKSDGAVEFHGAPGIGKTSILRHLAHLELPGVTDEGVVYHDLLDERVDDSLQSCSTRSTSARRPSNRPGGRDGAAVRERRREVGVLRSLGFVPARVKRAFPLESAFVALQGIAIGSVLGLITAGSLMASDEFGENLSLTIPWVQVGLLGVLVLLGSLLATAWPARQASKIPPAVALRIAE